MAAVAQPLVLLVEDSVELRETLEAFLVSCGYRVVAHADAESAFQAARAQAPDVVLTDVFLGTTSGLDLITALRTHLGAPPPIIACSGLPEIAGAARDRGAVGFLPKPLDPATLEHAVADLLAHRAPEPELLEHGSARSASLRAERVGAARATAATLAPYRGAIEDELQRDAEWLSAYLGFGTAIVAMAGDAGLRIVASSDRLGWPVDRDLAVALPISRHVLETGSAFVVPDLSSLSSGVGPGVSARFVASFPLTYHQSPIGVVCVLDDRPSGLDKADFGLLMDLCAGRSAILSCEVPELRPLGLMRRAALEAVLRSECDRASRLGLTIHLFAFASRATPPDLLAERTLVAELGEGRFALVMTRSTRERSPAYLVAAVQRIAALPGFGGGHLFSIEMGAVPRLDHAYLLHLTERRLEERIASGSAPSIQRVSVRSEPLGELTTPGAVS